MYLNIFPLEVHFLLFGVVFQLPAKRFRCIDPYEFYIANFAIHNQII